MFTKAVLFSAVVFLTLSCAGDALAQDYVIGEGDLLNISVYEQPELASQVRVSAGGVVNIPLAGEVKVAGLTVREAEKKLTGLLAAGYLQDPQVAIFVTEYRSCRVTVLGEIKTPGLYELNGNATLLEMISRAGGLTDKSGDTLIIKRKTTGGAAGGQGESVAVDLKDLMEKGDPASNVSLQDGDSIFINKSGFVYVTGEVQKPGAYKVEKDTTVIKAITLAGGLTPVAAPGRTVRIRKVGGADEETKVDMGDPVEPEDVISVPESFF